LFFFGFSFKRTQHYRESLCVGAVQSLLHDPNVNSPANNEAARLYREHRREYDKKVAAVVQESWLEDEDDDVDENVKDEAGAEARRDADSMLASSTSWDRCLVYDSFTVVLRRFSYLSLCWVFSYHISLDTCVPAEVLYVCVSVSVTVCLVMSSSSLSPVLWASLWNADFYGCTFNGKFWWFVWLVLTAKWIASHASALQTLSRRYSVIANLLPWLTVLCSLPIMGFTMLLWELSLHCNVAID